MHEVITIRGPSQRKYACQIIDRLQEGSRITFSAPSRTVDQNAMLWSILSQIAKRKPGGRDLSPNVWKCLFLEAFGQEVRFEKGLEGEPVPISRSTRSMSKKEMSELIDFIFSWCSANKIFLDIRNY
jgi:hypothetical protein